MSESELTELLFSIGARCNIEQYEMLLRCSKKKDITEWNQWRKANREEEIWLSGAKLWRAHLEGAYLWGVHLKGAKLWGAHLEGAVLTQVNLEGANLWEAHLEGAKLVKAHLEGADLREAYLEGAKLRWAYLEGAKLQEAHLKGADFTGAYPEGAKFMGANLEGAKLRWAYLEGAKLVKANLEGADLREAHLEGADFTAAMVDGRTIIWDCKINKKTDFDGVGLDAARVDPGLKQSLEYNIRRKHWREWYKEGGWWKRILKRTFIQFFWWMSDYGRSTGWIIGTFFVLALLFAGIYYVCGRLGYPGIVANLFEDEQGAPIQAWLVPFRAIYFSIVTMTTLGFGDMYADARSLAGHICLGIQVMLGYLLLGALITRFAVLFTAGGPAAKFADEKKAEW